MAKKPKLMRAYRLKLETITEIERLADEWECTHAEVVERAVRGIVQPLAKPGPLKSPLLKPKDKK